MTNRRLLSVALLCVSTSQVAPAQFISSRVAVGVIGEWRPSVQGGLEARGEIGSPTSYVDSMGVTHQTAPKLLWSAMGLAGMTWARAGRADSSPRATGQGQIGLLYRLSGAARVGFYGIGTAIPQGWGVAARYEPMPSAALQAGWIHRGPRPANVAIVQADVALAFLTDLLRGGGK